MLSFAANRSNATHHIPTWAVSKSAAKTNSWPLGVEPTRQLWTHQQNPASFQGVTNI